MSVEPSGGWDFDPPHDEDREEDSDETSENELFEGGWHQFDEIEPGTTLVYVRQWDPENDLKTSSKESDGFLQAVSTAASNEDIGTDYLNITSKSEGLMESQDREIRPASLKAVFEPLFQIVSLTGAAISAFLTVASLIATGFPLAAAFAVATGFFIYAYRHGIK